MARSTRLQAAKNRERVVEEASRLFRTHGLKGVGIADLMAAAGLTHGGFYKQFSSREAVAGEACARAMAAGVQHWKDIVACAGPAGAMAALVEAYLGRDAALNMCPMPTLAGDVAREAADSPVRQAFSRGLHDFADVLESCAEGPAPRTSALYLLAAMVGAVVISKASNDPAFAAEIINTVRAVSARSRPVSPAGWFSADQDE